MTEARWKATYDFTVGAGLLGFGKDWHRAFATEIVRDLNVTLD